MGARVIGCSEQSKSIQGTDKAILEEKPCFTDEEWQRVADGYNELAKIAAGKGMQVCLHHHMGTGIQTAEEVDRYMSMRGQGTTLTRQECARILFDEFRQLSRLFALYGPYKHLIEEMIGHMQHGNGTPFSSPHLNAALKAQIMGDKDEKNSTRLRLWNVFDQRIDWGNKFFPSEYEKELTKAIFGGKLPKFDRFQDNFNGMGITVHGAQHRAAQQEGARAGVDVIQHLIH